MLMRDDTGQVPYLRTPLPGPQARKLIERDESYTSPSYTRAYPLAVARGYGAVIEDVDGNRFLDFTAGIAVCATGHCHPHVTRAIRDQADRLLHMSGTDFYYEPQARLAERLATLPPGNGTRRVFFTNSGAESVEAAFKLARHHTGRQQMIAFLGAFHGRTMGALSLTGSKVTQRAGFAPLIPQVHHVRYPASHTDISHSDTSILSDGDGCDESLQQLEELFQRTVPPEEVAGIFVEPIQGEGGYIVPPPDFHRRLHELAQRHGILLIADEVQTGMGRTGRMFAMEHWGVEPDIICLAKGIASGMPLGAIIAKQEIMDWPPGSHASTFGGNPLSCVAALETIRLLEEGLIANAARVGDYLIQQLRDLASRRTSIRDVRGKGLMVAIELDRDGLRDRVVDDCFHRGLLLLGCGTHAVRFCPPLVITEDEVDTAVHILADVLAQKEETTRDGTV